MMFFYHRRIQNAHRTCSIWLGVGDGQEERFRLFEYSYSTANVRIVCMCPSWD